MSALIELYGQGVSRLKHGRELCEDLAERLDLPGEAVPGTPRLSLSGNRRLLIEEHRGVIAYSGERICVALTRGRLVLCGSGLRIGAMNRRELLICGKLQSLEWEGT